MSYVHTYVWFDLFRVYCLLSSILSCFHVFVFVTISLWLILNLIALLLLFSHSVVFDFLWPHGLELTRLPCPSPSSRACSKSCPLSWWCHPAISSSVNSRKSPSSPVFSLSQHQGLFQWVSSLHQVAKLLELQPQSFQWIFRVDFL